MATKKISIHEATQAQLRHVLETQYGVPKIHPSTNSKTLITKLMTMHVGSEIEVDDGLEQSSTQGSNVVGIPQEVSAVIAPAPTAGHALGGMSSRDAPKVTVMIFNGEGAAGTQKVFVGWNTKGMLIERGKPQPIPWPYYEILKTCIETQTFQNEAGEDVNTDVQAYPFQVLQMPPQAEIDAWRALTRLNDPTQKGNANYIGPPKRHRNAQ